MHLRARFDRGGLFLFERTPGFTPGSDHPGVVMAEKLDPKEIVKIEEVVISQMFEVAALVEKFKLDLFEKRCSVFAGARWFLTHIFRDGDLKTLDPLWEYRAAIGEAGFLFEEDIVEYLEEIYNRALKLHSDKETMQPLPVGDERKRLAHNISESLGWLTGQLPELKKRFSPYMKFETWT